MFGLLVSKRTGSGISGLGSIKFSLISRKRKKTLLSLSSSDDPGSVELQDTTNDIQAQYQAQPTGDVSVSLVVALPEEYEAVPDSEVNELPPSYTEAVYAELPSYSSLFGNKANVLSSNNNRSRAIRNTVIGTRNTTEIRDWRSYRF